MSATISIPGAGSTEPFEFSRPGKQGGIETPDEFNMFMERMMSPLVKRWYERGWGFRLDSGVIVNHLLWADNVWLIAEKKDDLAAMIEELTLAITVSKLAWKASSLEVLAGGLAVNEEFCFDMLPAYKVVQNLHVLGSLLDGGGSTTVMLDHRLHKAEQFFWKHSDSLLGQATISAKLKAWERGLAAVACFDSCVWTANKTLLERVRCWKSW